MMSSPPVVHLTMYGFALVMLVTVLKATVTMPVSLS